MSHSSHSYIFETVKPGMVKDWIDCNPELIEVRDEDGLTPLLSAACLSTPDVVRLLLDAGANVEARTEDGRTPLHMAAGGSKYPDVVKALLDKEARIEARTKDGRTPLHVAAGEGKYPDVVKALLDARANPRAKTSDGSTPWDLIQNNDALKGTDVSWLLHKARYE